MRENLGKTVQTVVPDLNARQGILPGRPVVAVSPVIRPYLDEFPLPNGANLGGGLAAYSFGFDQRLRQHFLQGRVDYNRSERDQFFARYTFDKADQFLPTDFPQFPRTFLSRNQFFTGEYRQTLSASTLNTFRFSFSRTRIGQTVESNVSPGLTPFTPGEERIGSIDIAGIPRFGTQSSADLNLVQNVWGGEYQVVHSRGRHLIKAGALAERYQDNMVNPTFSLGLFTFASLENFLLNRAQRFIGITPGGALDRYWRYTLVGLYAQDTYRAHQRLSLNAGVRYEFTTMPVDINGRDSVAAEPDRPHADARPALREPLAQEHQPARRLRVGRVRRRQDQPSRRLRDLLQHEQPAEPDRHRHEPARDAAPRRRQPRVPGAELQRLALDPARPVRPRQPVPARLQPEPPARAVVRHRDDGRLRRLARRPPPPERRREHPRPRHPRRRHALLGRRDCRARTRRSRPSS